MAKFVRYGKTSSAKVQFHALKKFIEYQLENSYVDESTKIPKTIKLTGTVKVHGSNFGVSLSKDGLLRFQTRENFSNPEHNNFGNFRSLFIETIGEEKLLEMLKPHLKDADRVMIFGELFGQGVQKRVAVSHLPVSYMAFSFVRVYEKTFTEDVYHTIDNEKVIKHHKGDVYFEKENLDLDLLPSMPDLRFYKSTDFKMFEEVVNIYEFQKSYDKLMEHTLEVENRCPVGCSIDPDTENTIGEGIVWTGELWLNGQPHFVKFKTKGDKHKRGKGSVKQKLEDSLTEEEKGALNDFYEQALSVDRLEQGFEYFNANGLDIEMRNIPLYVKWICNDVKEELYLELTNLDNLGIETRKVMKVVSKNASNYFIKRFNQSLN